jgi:Tfp pilus tip-associated adhesin PilY1
VIWSYTPSDNVNMRYPITASPTAVDINSDGRVNYVYVVDTGNQLWRFNVGTAGTYDNTSGNERITGGWTATRIFSPSSPAIAQRSFNKVDVAFDRGITPWVFFGTGNREKPEDPGTGRIYAIRDDGTGYPYDKSNLADLSSVISSNDNTLTGTIDQPPQRVGSPTFRSPTKVLSDVVVFNNNLFFTTFTSNTTNLCAGGGDARLYAINTGLAEAIPGASMTAGAGGLLPDSGTARVRSRLLAGGGIPSSPVISMSASGGARLYVGTTNTASVLSFAVDAPPVFKKIKSWKEYVDQ